MKLDYDSVNKLVDNSPNAFWDGWTAVFHTKNENGFMKKNGLLFNGVWGVAKRVNVEEDGTWVVPEKFAR